MLTTADIAEVEADAQALAEWEEQVRWARPRVRIRRRKPAVAPIYLGNASSPVIRALMREGIWLGQLISPGEGRQPVAVDTGIDNSCFSGAYPGDDAYLGWLSNLRDQHGPSRFATVPDTPGRASGTLDSFRQLAPAVAATGQRPALVAQNGMTTDQIPWDQVGCLFLGGLLECPQCGWIKQIGAATKLHLGVEQCHECDGYVVEWKTSAAAARLCDVAHEKGVPIHMGRVNSRERLEDAARFGCATVDGTFLSFGPDKNLARLARWYSEAVLWDRATLPGLLECLRPQP